MSNKTKINPSQLLAMIILFEFGTALVVPIGLKANQGVWLAILLALPAGLLLYVLYDYLHRQYPNMSLSEYIRKILGRYMGWPISLLYLAFFMFASARNLREGGDLLITSSYDQTPILVIHSTMMIAVIYVLHKGLEVFFRLGQIYLLIIVSLGIIGNVLIFASGQMDLSNLLPIQGEGWKSVIQTAYPYILMFPFAEVMCFTTILPQLNNPQQARKAGLIAMILSAAGLCLTHAVEISVLSKDIYSRSTFPLFTAISIVEIADFLQRPDAIVVLTLIIGVYFKMTMYAFAAMVTASDLFTVSDGRKLAVPIGITVLVMSILSASSFPEHGEEGLMTNRLILPFFCMVIPVLLFLVHFVRKRFVKSGSP